LFSGIGGFALATQWAGGETIAFAETAEFPARVLAKHWPDVPNLGDVTKLCRRIYDCKPEDENGDVECPRCGIEFGDCACIGTDQFTDTYGFPDVLTAGVPCQPASLVGKRDGIADERWMWPDTLRIIGELRPRFCVLENPRAILSLHDGSAFRDILREFAAIGYDVQWDVVSASALGAGHRRERLWILASYSDSAGLEGHARNGEAGGRQEAGRHVAQGDLRTREVASREWYRQSGIQPVVDGIPGRVAKDELTAVGNSLVPQVAYVWMSTIARVLNEAENAGAQVSSEAR
jgi:DNA (cytosine-5)-methyltransferase 1